MPFPLLVRRSLVVFGSIALVATASARDAARQRSVTLLPTIEHVPATALPARPHPFRDLAAIDPARPTADDGGTQTLSIFGREDLIAATSGDFRATNCIALPGSGDPLDEIVRRARATSIVIINESHERSRFRNFIGQVATRLRPLGYDTLAIETLSPSLPETPARYLPPFVTHPSLPYFSDADGFYLAEAAFGRLGRQAKALGYRLLPYEFLPQLTGNAALGQDQQIAVREEGQAENLARFVRAHPGARLLIHVGYSHAAEVPRADGTRWMAARLRQKTGIDPLTISQTTCHGGGPTTRLAALPASEPPGTFDLVVDHPSDRFVRGRPAWRIAAGDVPVTIPRRLRPTNGWRIIEARPDGEPTSSVPMDRVAIRPGEDIALMLPPGRYRLRVIDVPIARPTDNRDS